FPDNPMAFLSLNSLDFMDKLNALTFRLSYMAKHRTKRYSSTEHSSVAARVGIPYTLFADCDLFTPQLHSVTTTPLPPSRHL
ncbi:hypothetical protein ABQH29_14915, partial [Pectobacterium polaris]